MNSNEKILCIQAAIRELKKASDSDPPSPADAYRHFLLRLCRMGIALYINQDGIAVIRNVNTFMRKQFTDIRTIIERDAPKKIRQEVLAMIDEAIAAGSPDPDGMKGGDQSGEKENERIPGGEQHGRSGGGTVVFQGE